METQLINTTQQPLATEGIKLTKYSSGMGWEIRILSLDVDKLEALNKEMENRFGSLTE